MTTSITTTHRTTAAGETWKILTVAAIISLLTAGDAQAAFKGLFAPGNWKLTTNEASGEIELTQAPQQITFISSGEPGCVAAWTIQIPVDGEITFDWRCSPAREDSAGFSVDGASVTLASETETRGVATTPVSADKPFTFWIRPSGKAHPPSRLVISNFRFNGQPRIRRLAVGHGDVGVTFQSVPERTHRVQACSDLTTKEWHDVSPNILALDAETFYSMARAAGDKMFYRIVMLPEE